MNGLELLDALPVAVYMTDAKGNITYFNDAAAELWGRRPEPGEQWCGSWRLFWPDGRPMRHDECPMAVTLRTGEPVRGVEAVAERPNGTRILFVPYPSVVRDESGEITGAINLLMDVSDRMKSELTSARLAAIVQSSDDAIVSKTLDGKVTSWNASAMRIFGYAAEEMIGEPIIKIIPHELLSEETEILAKIRRGERIDHYETVRLTKDGRRINISLTVSPVRDRTGNVVGISKVARDITERKRAEDLQRLLLGELNHRVKNTLATVQAIAHQTLRRARSPVDFVSSFSGRVQALARAHTLLTQSTWLGADVMDMVRDQLLLGSEADDRITCEGPSLMLEPQVSLHLAMVLHELGTNARKYGALSVPTGRLSVSWEIETAGNRSLNLQWRESGGPMVQAPTERGFGSTLIEQSLQAHGGVASIRYGADGVTCEIKLPLPEREPGSAGAYAMARGGGAAALARATGRPPSGLSGKRVLVIEDEPLVAMDIASRLSEAGCEVIGPAGTLELARSFIESAEIDAALVDANLAGDPVDELAAALTRRKVPFAFVTGYGREALPQGFREAAMIGKPFTEKALLATIERIVERGADVVPLRQRPL
jgi:PAS domain S-box-containing protein